MMGDPVSQIAYHVESVVSVFAQFLNRLVGVYIWKNGPQMMVTYGAVVSHREHAFPEDKLKLCDHLTCCRLVAVLQEVCTRAVGSGRIGQGNFKALLVRPVGTVG